MTIYADEHFIDFFCLVPVAPTPLPLSLTFVAAHRFAHDRYSLSTLSFGVLQPAHEPASVDLIHLSDLNRGSWPKVTLTSLNHTAQSHG
jgi:hypothetical protein